MSNVGKYAGRPQHDIAKVNPLMPGAGHQGGISLQHGASSMYEDIATPTNVFATGVVESKTGTSTSNGGRATPRDILNHVWAATTLPAVELNYGYGGGPFFNFNPHGSKVPPVFAIDPQLLQLSAAVAYMPPVNAALTFSTTTFPVHNQQHALYGSAGRRVLGAQVPSGTDHYPYKCSGAPMASVSPSTTEDYGSIPTPVKSALNVAYANIPGWSESQAFSTEANNSNAPPVPARRSLRASTEACRGSTSQTPDPRFHPYPKGNTTTRSNQKKARNPRGPTKCSETLSTRVQAATTSLVETPAKSPRPNSDETPKAPRALPRHGFAFAGVSFQCRFENCSYAVPFLPPMNEPEARLPYLRKIEDHLDEAHRPQSGDRCKWVTTGKKTKTNTVCNHSFGKQGSTNFRHIRNGSHAAYRVWCSKCLQSFGRDDKIAEHLRLGKCPGSQGEGLTL